MVSRVLFIQEGGKGTDHYICGRRIQRSQSCELFAVHRQRQIAVLSTGGFLIAGQTTTVHVAAEILKCDCRRLLLNETSMRGPPAFGSCYPNVTATAQRLL